MRTHGQVTLLGARVEYLSKSHERISLLCLNVTRSQLEEAGRETCDKGCPYHTGATGHLVGVHSLSVGMDVESTGKYDVLKFEIWSGYQQGFLQFF